MLDAVDLSEGVQNTGTHHWLLLLMLKLSFFQGIN